MNKQTVISTFTYIVVAMLMIWTLNGCSYSKEVVLGVESDNGAFKFDRDKYGQLKVVHNPDVHYLVVEKIVVGSVFSNQPDSQGLKHCKGQYSSEEMAAIRGALKTNVKLSEFYGCTDKIERSITSDPAAANYMQGPASAVLLGAGMGVAGYFIGQGLSDSGTSINNMNNPSSFSYSKSASASSSLSSFKNVNLRKHW